MSPAEQTLDKSNEIRNEKRRKREYIQPGGQNRVVHEVLGVF